MGQRGGRGLTLEAVAREVGCTKQALVRRFGSKRALVRAFLVWDHGVVVERFRTVRQTHASPLAALRARFVLPAQERPDEVIDSSDYANAIVFFIEAGRDPELRVLYADHARVFEMEIAALLVEAQAAGEVTAGAAAAVAHHLMVAMIGASVMWVSNPQGSVVDRIAGAIEMVLAPHLTTASDPRPP